MSACWLNHHAAHRTRSWDVTLSRLLGIALVTSLGCRAGDVARSPGYTGNEHLAYKHVELMVNNGDDDNNNNGTEPTWDQVRARVTLSFAKGYKQGGKGESRTVRLRPITDVNNLQTRRI